MTIAEELAAAYAHRTIIAMPPSARDTGFDLDAGYEVELTLARMRRAAGHHAVGRKVGFANKAMWRALKLDTLVWAHMYSDTVRYADAGLAGLDVRHMTSPKIEPEIVFKLRDPVPAGLTDAAAVLEHVEWLALGFEIIDCVYADWKFQPADFVAAYGLHAALIVGAPLVVERGNIPALVEALSVFKVRLLKNNDVVAEGSGRNSLRSPALCLGELATAIQHRMPGEPLVAGELISSGTLTESQPIAGGETWIAEVDGLPVGALCCVTSPRQS